MYYKKVETYQFTVPKEFKAYLEFKADLKDSGIKFTDEGGSHYQTITIVTNGTFNKTEDAK